MGTRALVRVFEGDTELCCIYKQLDGYPDGLGADLKAFCESRRLVNGYPGGVDKKTIANGVGCFAAQLIAHLKGGPEVGRVYLLAPGTADAGQHYEYHLRGPDTSEPHFGEGPSRVAFNAFSFRRNALERVAVPESGGQA